VAEGVLHGFEDGLDGLLGLGARYIGFLYDGIYDVELDHNCLHANRKSMLDRGL
jgi:hypothetical protein